MRPILGNKEYRPFTINGETHFIVEPETVEELQHAHRAKDVLTQAINEQIFEDDEHADLHSLLQEQEMYIKEYLESIGDFDNRFLISNINFLSKKYMFRIGEIENMLGLSAGYISRTAKEKSGKKMSIDVVWKFAKLFEIDIKKLLSTDLRIPESNSNTDLAARFLEKAYSDTDAGLIEWTNFGGILVTLDESLQKSGIISGDSPEPIFRSLFADKETKCILYDDIFACNKIIEGCDILIIPYYPDYSGGQKFVNYEFLFRYYKKSENDPQQGTYSFSRFFTTIDSPLGHLNYYAEELYNLIHDKEYETRLSPIAKKVIDIYLGEGKDVSNTNLE